MVGRDHVVEDIQAEPLLVEDSAVDRALRKIQSPALAPQRLERSNAVERLERLELFYFGLLPVASRLMPIRCARRIREEVSVRARHRYFLAAVFTLKKGLLSSLTTLFIVSSSVGSRSCAGPTRQPAPTRLDGERQCRYRGRGSRAKLALWVARR